MIKNVYFSQKKKNTKNESLDAGGNSLYISPTNRVLSFDPDVKTKTCQHVLCDVFKTT